MDDDLNLTDKEIAAMFSAHFWAQRFPPFLNLEEAADLLRKPVNTLRDWRSRGRLNTCSRRVGKEVLFVRDRLIKQVFNQGLDNDGEA